jgi:3D (Asp-Asp-Asp) domain-containing protein
MEPLPVGAFQPLSVPADGSRSALSIGQLDSAFISDGAVTDSDVFQEPGEAPKQGPTGRRSVNQPVSGSGSVQKPPRSTLTGAATFYDGGTTAMRLPRGTIVVICGRGGCIQRTVTDYGPMRKDRIVDLYRPDFFAICGCASWSGTTTVTISVY